MDFEPDLFGYWRVYIRQYCVKKVFVSGHSLAGVSR